MDEQEKESIPTNPDTLGMRMLYIVCAELLTPIKYITTRLGQIDWELENPNCYNDPIVSVSEQHHLLTRSHGLSRASKTGSTAL